MKVLLLASFRKNKSGNIFGGAEKVIISLANWLGKKGHDVTLVSVEGNEKPYTINNDITYIGMEIDNSSKISTHLSIFKNTINVINKTSPEIIVGFWVHSMFYSLFSKKRKSILRVYSERNDPNLEYGMIAKLMRFFVMKFSKAIVFQTNDAKQYFPIKFQTKGVVIHNPTNIKKEDFSLSNNVSNRIVAVGRLNTQKNYPLLIATFKKLNNEYPDLLLEIYGEGPLRNQLNSMIHNYNLTTKVTLMGSKSNIPSLIKDARMYVLSSNYEGMPNALMEAMSIGLPVVSADCPCGGPKELIDDYKNGFLFKVGDSEDLYRTMKSVIEMQPIELNCIRNKAKNICETHSEDRIFSVWEDLLQKLIIKKEGIYEA